MARFIRYKSALSPEEAESLLEARAAAKAFESRAGVMAEVFPGYEGGGSRSGLVTRLKCGGKTAGRLCFSSPEVEIWLKGAALGVEAAKAGRKDRLARALERPSERLEPKDVLIWKAGARAAFSIWRRAELAGNSSPTLFDAR